MATNKPIYLPGLNGIRAIAAMSVVISHINNRLDLFGLENDNSSTIADYAVTVFFTLSGFLITYLLLLEKKETGTINIKQFYIRRVLRIWPLYYLYLLLVALILGFEHLQWPFLLYIFMLPNFRNSIAQYFSGAISKISGSTSLVGHYWSLGVEEQFYAFWPWIVKNSKYLLIILLVFPIVYILLKIILNLIHAPYSILVFVNYTRFGCMFIGALGAYLYFYRNDWILKYGHNRLLEILAIFFFGLVTFNIFHIASPINHEIASVFTLVIIFNQISNPKKIFSLENRLFNFLGKISYGLYVWNPLIIYLLSLLFQKQLSNFSENTIWSYLLVYGTNILAIVLISYLSYEYYEKRFLKFKTKFMIIKSRS